MSLGNVQASRLQYTIPEYACHLVELTSKFDNTGRTGTISERDLNAVAYTLTRAIGAKLGDSDVKFDLEDLRRFDRLLIDAYAKNHHAEIPTGRRYNITEALTELTCGAQDTQDYLYQAASLTPTRSIRNTPARNALKEYSFNYMAPLLVGEPADLRRDSAGNWIDTPANLAAWAGFEQMLADAKKHGADAVSTDVWWGLVEPKDGEFNWTYYERIAEVVERAGLCWVPILSFHQCGGNVGDDVFVPIPSYLGQKYAHLAPEAGTGPFAVSEQGNVCKETLSVWATQAAIGEYEKVMTAFQEKFGSRADLISEINISLGPAGELRYPSYNAHDQGTGYPTRGALQAYSPLARVSWQNFAMAKYGSLSRLNEAWGTDLNSADEIRPPQDANNFFTFGHDKNTAYGRDLFDWYNDSLMNHGRSLLGKAVDVFNTKDAPFRGIDIGAKVPGVHWRTGTDRTAELNAGLIRSSEARTTWNMDVDGHGYNNVVGLFAEVKTRPHAPNIVLHFTCLEMDDGSGGPSVASRAESLVSWVAAAAAHRNVTIKGENALPVGSPDGWVNVHDAISAQGYDGLTLLRLPQPEWAMREFERIAATANASSFADGPTSLDEIDTTPTGPITKSPSTWNDSAFYIALLNQKDGRTAWSGFNLANAEQSHAGDLPGLTQHLDEIQALGCNTLCLTPVAHGLHAYGDKLVINALGVDPSRGNAEDLRRLVDACHQRGMRIILDVVVEPRAVMGASKRSSPKSLARVQQWWMSQFDLDGFRLHEAGRTQEFWNEFNGEVIRHAREIGKDNFLLVALDSTPPSFSSALRCTFTGGPSCQIGAALRELDVETRTNVVFNSINRPDFERFLDLVDDNPVARDTALATMFCAPGLPCVSYGSDYVKKLQSLRAALPVLQYGSTQVRWEKNDRCDIYAFARKLEGTEVLFVANPTDKMRRAETIRLDPQIFQPGDSVIDQFHPRDRLTVGGSKDEPLLDVTLDPHAHSLWAKANASFNGLSILGVQGLHKKRRATPSQNMVTTDNKQARAINLERTKERASHNTDRAVVYQLLVRTFGNVNGTNQVDGDIHTNGVGKFSDINDAALEEIKKQGHTHVYLSGVLRQATATDYSDIGLPADDPDILKGKAGSPWAIKDYFDVCPDYADNPANRLAEFKELIERIKAKGLKPMIDMVPNHVARSYHSVVRPDLDFGSGDDRSKFFDLDNNFYYLNDEPGRGLTINRKNAPEGADGKFAGEDGSPGHPPRMTGNTMSYEVGDNDWCETVKLNYGLNPKTGELRIDPLPDTWVKMDQIIAYWQGMGIEGFRVDYAHVVPIEFWKWAIARAKNRDSEFKFIGEAYETSPDRVEGFTLGKLVEAGFDGVYDAELYHGLREVIAGSKWANDIDGWLEKHAFIEDHLVRYAENHDEPRIAAARRPDDLWNSGMGNAAAGKSMAAILFLGTRGPNLLYNGQEIGETADGKAGFGGGNSRTTIFDYWTMPAHANWVGKDHSYNEANLTPEQRELRSFYRVINGLTKSAPFAKGARYNLQSHNTRFDDYGPGEHVYSFLRYDDQGHRALVVVNLSDNQTFNPTVRIPDHAVGLMNLHPGEVKLTSLLGGPLENKTSTAQDLTRSGVRVLLPPYGVSVIQID